MTLAINCATGHENVPLFILCRNLQPHLTNIGQRRGKIMAGPEILDPYLDFSKGPIAINGGEFNVSRCLQPLYRHFIFSAQERCSFFITSLFGSTRCKIREE